MYNNHTVSFVSFANSRYASQERIKREAEEMHFFEHIYVATRRCLSRGIIRNTKTVGPSAASDTGNGNPISSAE